MITSFLYDASQSSEWDEFNRSAKNGHFMFARNYMEYHADRFNDFSVVFRDESSRIIALLPANRDGETLHSHQGLTFGGLILAKKAAGGQVLEVFQALIDFAVVNGISKIIYKRIPDLYSKLPAQEDLYALFLHDAKLIRRDLGSTVDLQTDYTYTKGRKWSVNKAKKENVCVQESADLEAYWQLLSSILDKQHGTKPVHSVEEIHLLRQRFPENIRLFSASRDDVLLAGTLLFVNEGVVHTQYMANSDIGREIGALDYLIDQLMKVHFSDKRFFSFGISTEQAGTILNQGLLAQKEGFGARATVHDFYEIKIR